MPQGLMPEASPERIPIVVIGKDDQGRRKVTRLMQSPRGYFDLVMVFGPAAVMREEDYKEAPDA